MRKRRCPICFEYFTPNSNSQRFCSEDCRKFAKKKAEAEKKPKKKKKIKSLTQLRLESKKLGTTYGKYVAYREVEHGKQVKKEKQE